MTKKEAKQFTRLVNDVMVWNNMINTERAKGEDKSYEKVKEYMDLHDDSAKQLNEMLGTEAVPLYFI